MHVMLSKLSYFENWAGYECLEQLFLREIYKDSTTKKTTENFPPLLCYTMFLVA